MSKAGLLLLPWIEKYRPNSFTEMIDHVEKIDILKSLIKNKELTHLIFYGVPGSGKTSLILACAKEMYGDQYQKYTLELNASDERGIETARTKIPNFIKAASDKIRLVILDEADSLTIDAQSALRRIIEKYSKYCRFCIICNNINKIIPGLQSRCARMRFGHLNAKEIRHKLDFIIQQEHVNITDEALDLLINLNRDFRQILNTLQCIHSTRSPSETQNEGTPIEAHDIYEYTGHPSQEQINAIIDIVTQKSFPEACNRLCDCFRDNQWDLSYLVHQLVKYVVNHPEMNTSRKYYLVERLSEIEVKISSSNDSEVQLYAVVAAFQKL